MESDDNYPSLHPSDCWQRTSAEAVGNLRWLHEPYLPRLTIERPHAVVGHSEVMECADPPPR